MAIPTDETKFDYLTVCDYTQRIGDAFLVVKHKRTPGYRINEKARKCFKTAACLCLQHGFTPEQFVRFIEIANDTAGVRHFNANQLTTPRALAVAQEYQRTQAGHSWQEQYNRMTAVVINCLRNHRKLEEILLDDSLELAPWFRLAVCLTPLPPVVRKYGPQVEANPERDEYLKTLGVDPSTLYSV